MDIQTKIREQILRWLTRRDHSKHEIRQKLRLKQLPIEEAETIIARLEETDVINEIRYSESYTRMRKKKGYGPIRINLELKSRGISEEIIAETLNIPDNDWFIEAKSTWQRQFKGIIPQDFTARAKQMRFLQQRGFNHDHIKNIFSCDEYENSTDEISQ